MKRLFVKGARAVALLSFAAVAIADPDIRMHRSQAGSFTVSTWVLAESTEGRFSVQMPAPFDDFTQKSRIAGETSQAYFMEAKTGDGMRFSAVRAELPDAAEAQRKCSRQRAESAFGAALKARREFQVDGRTVVELTVNDGRAWMLSRAICLDTESMVLIVAAPLDRIATAETMARKFFDSLRLKPD